ncbi:hypothetical protein MJO29_011224 [Puccinia striiformis f. sp. tritici]|nr:hypothetical protein Pst134EB_021903 [Puccinia striiformis f. sp. tritici]KAI7946697.1 hypothetical protein MJO29_011224 [Puccinia striiformis f. sp. tritici]
MDLLKSIQNYITKMIDHSTGIKVLLLDSDTTPIISLAATQSNLLEHEIYLTDSISNSNRDPMHHLKCICFLRPTTESLRAMEEELRNPRYKEYWLYFSNILKKSEIEILAEADERELVREVQEYFADYAPITSSHFSLNIQPYNPIQRTQAEPNTITLSSLVNQPRPLKKLTQRSLPIFGDSTSTWNISTGALERHVQCLSALCLSLKKKPIIRYSKLSKMSKKLGQELLYQIQSEPQLFDFRLTHPSPVLLIIDRKDDPVSPLLTQWTYQAMVHEILGIENGRVDLSGVPEIRNELKEIVLSTEQDQFFNKNLYSNFGDLGASIKSYVTEFQAKSVSSKLVAGKIDTVQDMKKFLEEYPEHRKLSTNVSKHVTLVGELSRLVSQLKLLEVSELEQSLAANESHASDLKNVREMIASPLINKDNKIRLSLLYALRYQKFNGNNILSIIDLLKEYSIPEEDTKLIYILLNFSGVDKRQTDLFNNSNFFSRSKSVLKGLKGVENVYTQHNPPLIETIELLLKGKLKELNFPFLDSSSESSQHQQEDLHRSSSNNSQNLPIRPIELMVFVVGGTTYEEARSVALLNERLATGQGFSGPGPQPQPGARVILGGTCVHNSKTFLDWLRDIGTKFPEYKEAKPGLIANSTTQTGDTSFGDGSGFNLQLGNLSVNVGSSNNGGTVGSGAHNSNNVAAGFEEFGDAAVDGVRNLFGRVRKGVVGGF